MAIEYFVTATCEDGHKQEMTYRGVSRQQAELFVRLLDGTSPLYVIKPGPDSRIGRCGICSKPFTCDIQEREFTEDVPY